MDLRRRVVPGALVAVLAACSSTGPSDSIGTSSPTASGAPSVSRAPTASQQPVPFVADVDRLSADLEALQAAADANGGIRAAGTPGYEASVDHVAAAMEEIGFSVTLPEVSFIGFRELPGSRLEVGGTVVEGADELHALIYSPSGDLSGPVAVLTGSGCDQADFAGIPDGAIALTTMGGCFRRDQAINAAAAGAVALIVGYPDRGPGEIFRPTLIDPDAIEIPVVSVTGATVDLLADADEARLVVATEREPSTLHNVIAQLGDGPSIVMLGAHLDSVLDGPGINDNGSGVAALLEIARGLAATGVPDGWAVRIGLWGGEEFGTIGSRAYAATMGDEVTAYLNLDMTGSVNGANLVYDEAGAAPGSTDITAAFDAWFAESGLESEHVDIGGSSDHFGFTEAGIPTGGLFAGASESGSASQPSAGGGGPAMDPCYHIACDTIDNVDPERVATFAEATFAVTLRLMQSEP
ncbi:MAG TPA: M20/M25/M40 family metallo-hydrolase [Candidatus Limnocylindria bacterium]